MTASLSNLTNNLSDQLYNNCSDCKNPLDYMIFKDDKMHKDMHKDCLKHLLIKT